MKETIYSILFIIGIVILTAVVTRWQFPRTETVIEYEQEEIDEGVWVRRSSYNSLQNITDSLYQENEVLASEIESQGQEIANFTRIVGHLNTEKDSLREEISSLELKYDEDGELADTTYKFTETFGDSLFEVRSEVGISQGMLSNSLELRQVRDININVVTSVSDKQDLVMTYVHSNDFVNLEYSTTHSLQEGRFTKTEWFLIGLGGGLVLSAGLILAL